MLKTKVTLPVSIRFFLTFIVFAFTPSLYGKTISEKQSKLNGGYYLLHHLCDEESQLPMLTLIKHTPKNIAAFTNKVSDAAKSSIRALDQNRNSNPAIDFDKNPLPPIEMDVRASISEAKEHQLLFGTSNEAFVTALLVSQLEASNYALNIAKVLSEQETNSNRVQVLRHIQAKWQAVRDEAYSLLQANASSTK